MWVKSLYRTPFDAFGAYAVDDSAGSGSEIYGPPVPDAGPSYTKYIVLIGDDLGKIAAKFLGSPGRWRELWDANPNIVDPDRIVPGQVLMIPSVRVSTPAPSAPGVMPGPKISAVTTGQSSFVDSSSPNTVAEDPFSDLTPSSDAPFYQNPMVLLGVGLLGAILIMGMSRSRNVIR